VGFFVSDIAPWLSHQIIIAFFSFMYLKSFMNFVIHIASLVDYVLAMYLALVIGKTIMGYRFLLQENGSTSHHEYKPHGGSPIFKVTSPICIAIFNHFLGW
jgi:hypothetical protein